MVPPDPPIFFLNLNKKVLVEKQVVDESGGKIERTHPKTRTFHFKTIRKMYALRNE